MQSELSYLLYQMKYKMLKFWPEDVIVWLAKIWLAVMTVLTLFIVSIEDLKEYHLPIDRLTIANQEMMCI